MRPATPSCSQVDFSEEEGQFQGVTSACMGVLVLGLNTRLDQALQVCMGRMGVHGGHDSRMHAIAKFVTALACNCPCIKPPMHATALPYKRPCVQLRMHATAVTAISHAGDGPSALGRH